jgi:Uma2 family endonuclease
MSETSSLSMPLDWTAADMQRQLGGIPLERIRMNPAPGTATVLNVIELDGKSDRLYELVDGVLVEKTTGYLESRVAVVLAMLLEAFARERNAGIVVGADGPCLIFPDQVRIPDVSFVAWESLPDGRLPDHPVPKLVPDLAVEILSPGNTPAEMQRKLQDYFRAGVRLVWYIDARGNKARCYTSPEHCVEIDENGVLDGGEVLPTFKLMLKDLLDQAMRRSES